MYTSKKTTLVSISAILVIGGAVYFAKPRKAEAPITAPLTAPLVVQDTRQVDQPSTTTLQEPTKDSSSVEIIDYLVDDLTKNESQAAEAVIDKPTPTQAEIMIGTNF